MPLRIAVMDKGGKAEGYYIARERDIKASGGIRRSFLEKFCAETDINGLRIWKQSHFLSAAATALFVSATNSARGSQLCLSKHERQ
ncbi:hypothetical protein NPIL_267341 [Nephila pilipes]|uniref:Uncharacterized protein n=1 Tax=Nephila pilipes TaxID=299642 RepID=A0A8X6T3T3_NEPPI|nr:hypothetical protein NPIL_267341 [Nephila pilipes]